LRETRDEVPEEGKHYEVYMGTFDDDDDDDDTTGRGEDGDESESALLLVGFGFDRRTAMLAGAGELLARAIEELDTFSVEEMHGIGLPSESVSSFGCGLYVWDGIVSYEEDSEEYEFDGEWRRASAEEAALAANAKDPWPTSDLRTFYL
jgi:hypothetical protein